MRKLIDWIRSWYLGARINRTILSVDRRLKAIERERASVEAELQKRSEALEALGSRLDVEVKTGQAGIERAEKLVLQYESQIDAIRSERDVAVERTIPALVASHEVLIKRYDAEAAIQVRREVAASMPQEREGLG